MCFCIHLLFRTIFFFTVLYKLFRIYALCAVCLCAYEDDVSMFFVVPVPQLICAYGNKLNLIQNMTAANQHQQRNSKCTARLLCTLQKAQFHQLVVVKHAELVTNLSSSRVAYAHHHCTKWKSDISFDLWKMSSLKLIPEFPECSAQ